MSLNIQSTKCMFEELLSKQVCRTRYKTYETIFCSFTSIFLFKLLFSSRTGGIQIIGD